MIPIPRQRNSREENAQIKAGEVPEAWQENTNELEQKDVDAKWTKKNGQSYYGYKNHIDIDVKHKLIRNYAVTDASVHDSQVMNEFLDPHNTGAEVYGDSAYRSEEQERELAEAGYRSKIHHKGKRNQPLSEYKQKVNKNRSKIRAKVEHVFGNQMMMMGGKIMRCIGKIRATAQIGLRNLVYNMNRLVFLSKLKAKTT